MRAVLAIAAVLLVLVAVVAPHHHGGAYGDHACAACVFQGGESAHSETPDVSPSPVVAGAPAALVAQVAPGAPLGAVPGQSPPRA